MENYDTVLICDDKGRVTIPVKVRELLNGINNKLVFKFSYDPMKNEVILIPIGATDTK